MRLPSFTRGMTLAELTDIAEQNRKAIVQSLASASTSSSSAPALIQALTSVDGSQVLLYFNTPMSSVFPAAPAGFTVKLNTASDVVTAIALGANLTCIALTLTTKTYAPGDALTVSYTPGAVKSSSGVLLTPFTAQSVVNALAPYVETRSTAWANPITFTLTYGYINRPTAFVYSEDGGSFSLAWTQATVGGIANCYSYATVTPLGAEVGTPNVNFLAVCSGMVHR
jgi:hypothetical protein